MKHIEIDPNPLKDNGDTPPTMALGLGPYSQFTSSNELTLRDAARPALHLMALHRC